MVRLYQPTNDPHTVIVALTGYTGVGYIERVSQGEYTANTHNEVLMGVTITGLEYILPSITTAVRPEAAHEAHMPSMRVGHRRMVSTSILRVVGVFASHTQSFEDVRGEPTGGRNTRCEVNVNALTDCRVERRVRRTTTQRGLTSGIVERVFCWVLVACDYTVVRRLGWRSRIKDTVGHSKPIELCTEERRVRTTSILGSQQDGPGDRMCAWKNRTRWAISVH